MAIDVGGGRTRVSSTTKKKPVARRSTNGPTAGYGYGGHGVNYSEYTNLKRQSGTYDPVLASQGMTYGGGGRGGSSGGSRGGGYYSGGGGGGGSAAAAAAEKARQRALVEGYYKQGLGSLNSARNSANPALAKARADVLKQLAQVYAQNKAATGATSRDLQGIQANAMQALAQRQAALQRDLGAQGADTQGLMAAGADYQADARSTGEAQNAFNSRLGQVMQTSYGDDQGSANLVNQSALGQLQANYAQALQALQNARIQALMGLA